MEATDYGLCPVCREPTDNGHSRELPPEAYVCSACAMQVNKTSSVTLTVADNLDESGPIFIPSNWPAPDYDIVEYVTGKWLPDHADLKQHEDDAQEWGYRLVRKQEELRRLRETIRRLENAYRERASAVEDAWSEYQGEKDVDYAP